MSAGPVTSSGMDPDPARSRRASWLLIAGAIAGLLLAGRGLVLPDRLPAAGAVLAEVNGTSITRARFEQSMERLAADKRNPLTDADRAHVLQRMIEEELLIQRGVEIGLVESERGVRAAIVSAMIDSIVADSASLEPDAGQLRRFHAENASYFARPARMHVQRIWFRTGADGERRASEAHAALAAGEDFAAVRQRLGDTPVAPLPDAPLPPAKLRDYIGPGLVRSAAALQPGAHSQPISTTSGLHIVRLVSHDGLTPLPLEEVREQVAAEYRRREGDRALREYLDWLRSEAEVALASDAPAR